MRGGARKVWLKHAVAGALAAVVLGGGYLWLDERSPATRLGEACGGMLPVDDMLALTGTTASGFGGADLKLESWRFDVSADVVEPKGLATRCRANGVEVAIETASGSHNAYGTYTFQTGDDEFPIPLRSRWSGFVVVERLGDIGSSVLLDCPNWTPREGSGILVTVDSDDNGDASMRVDMGRLAVRTAARTAARTGCDADLGGSVERLDSAATTERKSAARASGTCEGLRSREYVQETAATMAPVEHCVLVGGLRLHAAYGPFVTGDEK